MGHIHKTQARITPVLNKEVQCKKFAVVKENM